MYWCSYSTTTICATCNVIIIIVITLFTIMYVKHPMPKQFLRLQLFWNYNLCYIFYFHYYYLYNYSLYAYLKLRTANRSCLYDMYTCSYSSPTDFATFIINIFVISRYNSIYNYMPQTTNAYKVCNAVDIPQP